MPYNYRVVTDTNENAFGIAVIEGTSIVDYAAVSILDKLQVYSLVGLCNNLQLDPIHLRDVVCDAEAACDI